MKRKRKEIGNLDFALSTRNSIRKMVAEFSLTCYKDMASSLVNPLQPGVAFLYPLKSSENL